MNKLTSLIREIYSIGDWKFLTDFLCRNEKKNVRFMALMIRQDRLQKEEYYDVYSIYGILTVNIFLLVLWS